MIKKNDFLEIIFRNVSYAPRWVYYILQIESPPHPKKNTTVVALVPLDFKFQYCIYIHTVATSNQTFLLQGVPRDMTVGK